MPLGTIVWNERPKQHAEFGPDKPSESGRSGHVSAKKMGSKKFIFFGFWLLAQPNLETSTCLPCNGIAQTSSFTLHTATTPEACGLGWNFALKVGVYADGATDHV